MKSICKFLFLFSALILLFTQCGKEEPEAEPLIPDENFLNALIALGVDTDYDREISPAEARAIEYLDVSARGIVDMTGLEAFVNLQTLLCYDNQIRVLDVSNNLKLGEGFWNISLDIRDMADLFEVCVWTTPFPPEGMGVNRTGSPNAYFTTECSK